MDDRIDSLHGNKRIQVYDSKMNYIRTIYSFGEKGSIRPSRMTDLEVSDNGNLYVAYYSGDEVYTFGPEGGEIGTISYEETMLGGVVGDAELALSRNKFIFLTANGFCYYERN